MLVSKPRIKGALGQSFFPDLLHLRRARVVVLPSSLWRGLDQLSESREIVRLSSRSHDKPGPRSLQRYAISWLEIQLTPQAWREQYPALLIDPRAGCVGCRHLSHHTLVGRHLKFSRSLANSP